MSDPMWIDASSGAPSYNATELRRLMGAYLYQNELDDHSVRSGVHPSATAPFITSPTATSPTITCAGDFRVTVRQSTGSSNGSYVAILDAQNISVTRDATNPRWDILVARVRDHAIDGSGARAADYFLVAGTAAASPSEPAQPAGTTRLGRVTVPTGTSAVTFTPDYPFYVGLGSQLPVRSSATLPSANMHEGALAYDMTADRGYVHNGTSWIMGGNSPFLDATTTGWTSQTGWSGSSFTANTMGRLATGVISVTRTGANVAVPSDGNLTDTDVIILPPGYWPSYDFYNCGGDGRLMYEYRIRASDGMVTMRAATPSQQITQNNTFRFSFTYVIP